MRNENPRSPVSPDLACRGFCYFNSVAIAAKLLQQRLDVSKTLIVDWVSGALPRQGPGAVSPLLPRVDSVLCASVPLLMVVLGT